MAIDDRFNGLVTDCTNGFEQDLAIVLAVSRIEGNEIFVGINNADGREPIAAQRSDPFCRPLDSRLCLRHFGNAVEYLPVGDCAVLRFSRGDRSTHVGIRRRSTGLIGLYLEALVSSSCTACRKSHHAGDDQKRRNRIFRHGFPVEFRPRFQSTVDWV
jgi:hypothetical protein